MVEYSFDFMYDAVLRTDSQYDGKFFTCVKSTKIFCIPSCKAKKPLKRNVEFVYTPEKALALGYRPCKRCYPLNSPTFCPAWLSNIETHLNTNLDRIISDLEIMDLVNVEITTIRRYFKKKHCISIKEYHRKKRLDKARDLHKKGLNFEKIAPLVGYQSSRGLEIAYKKEFGDLKNES